MKAKIIAATLLGAVFALPVNATPLCEGSATGGKKDVAAGVAGAENVFIIRTFAQACSKNVFMDYSQTSTSAAVAAVSKKGATVFGGTTEGGGGANCLKLLDSTEQKSITASTGSSLLTKAEKAEFCGSTTK